MKYCREMKVAFVMTVVFSLFALCGCNFSNIVYENSITSTDDAGKEYVILNPNHFRFDAYNVLEVIVGDTEKFLICDQDPNDGREGGPGLWYRNGMVAYIWAWDDNDIGKVHGNLFVEIRYPRPYTEYYVDVASLNFEPTKNHKDYPSGVDYVACITNDPDNPGLQWWVDGVFDYNCRFSEEITPVEYKTYTIEDAYRKFTLPEPVYRFYTAEKEASVTYSCEEAGFQWDAATGKGTWVSDGKTVPISVKLDEEQFALEVTCDTEDEFAGTLLYSAKGTSINETTAIYSVETTPNAVNWSCRNV